jgi:hypothetical protein
MFATFVVAPVGVSAKRIVEDNFYVRERAVIQIRHGDNPQMRFARQTIAFLVPQHDPIRMM